jgi:hypothetical protein
MASTVYIEADDVNRLVDRVIHPNVHNRAQIVKYFSHLIHSKYGEASMLARVILDIVPEPTYSVGDTIYVHRDRIYIGIYDFDKTLEAGLILAQDNSYIKAKITEINKFADSCYNIEVHRVQSSNGIDVYKTTASEQHIYHEKIIPAPGRLNVGDII